MLKTLSTHISAIDVGKISISKISFIIIINIIRKCFILIVLCNYYSTSYDVVGNKLNTDMNMFHDNNFIYTITFVRYDMKTN